MPTGVTVSKIKKKKEKRYYPIYPCSVLCFIYALFCLLLIYAICTIFFLDPFTALSFLQALFCPCPCPVLYSRHVFVLQYTAIICLLSYPLSCPIFILSCPLAFTLDPRPHSLISQCYALSYSYLFLFLPRRIQKHSIYRGT